MVHGVVNKVGNEDLETRFSIVLETSGRCEHQYRGVLEYQGSAITSENSRPLGPDSKWVKVCF